MLKLELAGELHHQVVALCCSEICSQRNKKYLHITRYGFDIGSMPISYVLCQQTQIYEAEYQTEHNDHKHTQQENRRLRKKREEMRQQVALLQEQVMVYTCTHTLINY